MVQLVIGILIIPDGVTVAVWAGRRPPVDDVSALRRRGRERLMRMATVCGTILLIGGVMWIMHSASALS